MNSAITVLLLVSFAKVVCLRCENVAISSVNFCLSIAYCVVAYWFLVYFYFIGTNKENVSTLLLIKETSGFFLVYTIYNLSNEQFS